MGVKKRNYPLSAKMRLAIDEALLAAMGTNPIERAEKRKALEDQVFALEEKLRDTRRLLNRSRQQRRYRW